MRSAVAAFGFVYIHPLADGNGRVHRILINDTLRRDNALPDPVILPVSAVITGNAGERRNYDRILDCVPVLALRVCARMGTSTPAILGVRPRRGNKEARWRGRKTP